LHVEISKQVMPPLDENDNTPVLPLRPQSCYNESPITHGLPKSQSARKIKTALNALRYYQHYQAYREQQSSLRASYYYKSTPLSPSTSTPTSSPFDPKFSPLGQPQLQSPHSSSPLDQKFNLLGQSQRQSSYFFPQPPSIVRQRSSIDRSTSSQGTPPSFNRSSSLPPKVMTPAIQRSFSSDSGSSSGYDAFTAPSRPASTSRSEIYDNGLVKTLFSPLQDQVQRVLSPVTEVGKVVKESRWFQAVSRLRRQ
jgi:hypothetical protein